MVRLEEHPKVNRVAAPDPSASAHVKVKRKSVAKAAHKTAGSGVALQGGPRSERGFSATRTRLALRPVDQGARCALRYVGREHTTMFIRSSSFWGISHLHFFRFGARGGTLRVGRTSAPAAMEGRLVAASLSGRTTALVGACPSVGCQYAAEAATAVFLCLFLRPMGAPSPRGTR